MHDSRWDQPRGLARLSRVEQNRLHQGVFSLGREAVRRGRGRHGSGRERLRELEVLQPAVHIGEQGVDLDLVQALQFLCVVGPFGIVLAARSRQTEKREGGK